MSSRFAVFVLRRLIGLAAGKSNRLRSVCKFDTGNVVVLSYLILEVFLHFLIGYAIEQFGSGTPVLHDFGNIVGDFAFVNSVDSLCFGPVFKFGGVERERAFHLAFLFIPLQIVFVVEEHFDVGCNDVFMFDVLAVYFGNKHEVGIGILCVGEVFLQFVSEHGQSGVVVLYEVFISIAGICFHILLKFCTERSFVEVCALVVVENFGCDFGKRTDTIGCFCFELSLEAVLLSLVVFLRAVLFKTDYIGGVNGTGSGIDGIEIYIVVEKNVFHGKIRSVGKTNVVLQNEIIGGGIAFGVVLRLEHFGYNRFVGSVSNAAVLIVGEHSYLSHVYNRAVGSAGGEERVENLIYFLSGEHESVFFVVISRVSFAAVVVIAIAACQSGYAERHAKCKRQRN